MATREEILGKIKASLQNGKTDPVLPPPPEVWPMQNLSADALFEQFAASLKAAAGTAVWCRDRADAAEKIAQQLKTLPGSVQLGVKAETVPMAEMVGGKYTGTLTLVTAPQNPADADPKRLETMSASLIAADFLLADTGSAAIRSRSAFDRLLCYLAPVCLIAAGKSALREHLPDAWKQIKPSLTEDAAPKGEYLLMTGPSRTADIEKILILGVHGPKTVIVYVIDNE